MGFRAQKEQYAAEGKVCDEKYERGAVVPETREVQPSRSNFVSLSIFEVSVPSSSSVGIHPAWTHPAV